LAENFLPTMPEVRSASTSAEGLSILMRRTQAEQTDDGNYEIIDYHTFKAVEYDRNMSWKGGSGWIALGVVITSRRGTDTNKDEELLPAGRSVLVVNTNFKLVRKN
jgi:hypothetical protein